MTDTPDPTCADEAPEARRPIEGLARAICAERGLDPDDVVIRDGERWRPAWRAYEAVARAALDFLIARAQADVHVGPKSGNDVNRVGDACGAVRWLRALLWGIDHD